MPLSGVFETQNGALVLVGAFKANPLRDICTALEIDDLSQDPRFATWTQQFKHKAELQAIFRERFANNTREHWLARLEAQDLLCAPVRDMREALVDPQTLHNEMILEGDARPSSRCSFIGSPIHMSAPGRACGASRRSSGEHTEEVLAEARALTRERPRV